MNPSSSNSTVASAAPSDAQPRRPIRLLLVDDHPVMRAGLANLLAMSGDFAVVGQADDGTAALQMWGTLAPDACSTSAWQAWTASRRCGGSAPSTRTPGC
jgi:PleD family two-component response regulator